MKIEAGGWNAGVRDGNFLLHITSVEVEKLSRVTGDVGIDGRLVRWYAVDLSAGERVAIALDSDFDYYLYARLPGGGVFMDDDSVGNNSRLSITMDSSGRVCGEGIRIESPCRCCL